jgi:glutathione S-transferase
MMESRTGGKIQLGYYQIRGRAQPIRYTLAYLNIEWDDIFYDQEKWG